MENRTSILSGFQAITLAEMDGVKLMDRSDTKFLMTETAMFSLLPQLTADYRLLEVEGRRISRYESLYFDLPGFALYQQHRRGKLPRVKVRCRRYVESGQCYLEVKLKSNKGRTIKERVKQEEFTSLSRQGRALITRLTGLPTDELHPSLQVDYGRITLVNRHLPERITLDMQLAFSGNGNRLEIPRLLIAEVKQEKSCRSPFVQLLHDHHIRQGSVSKYCWGLISLYDNIPHNRFKEKLSILNKITYGTAANIA